MMERAFSAFEALPPPDGVVVLTCWDVLDLEADASRDAITAAYRRRARTAHPDQGGTREEWDQLRTAYDQALAACREAA
jgi:curved DNA-binding protein CbpA